ncbi:MAG: mechanosensitive ion channel family protein [Bacteroidales bacterium]|nr:mechanosensitive ion channel family protein [Bacteroidales bacterium]
MNTSLDQLTEFFIQKFGLTNALAEILTNFTAFAFIVLLAGLAFLITKNVLLKVITHIANRTATHWDNLLVDNKFFHRLAHITPAVVIHLLVGVFFVDVSPEDLQSGVEEAVKAAEEMSHISLVDLVRGGVRIYMIFMFLLAVDAFINTAHQIYLEQPVSKDRPIKGYIQVLKIFVYFIAIILILSTLLGKEPSKLLAGLGALAAVLLLVFKDTILGFTASIQLSANDMVRIGDWIVMPSRKADGNVLEITLNTVKVQNWDKTITTIPTYALVSESYHNWRGMEESGGRRIKRHINLDMKSVKFCTDEMLERFKKFSLLKDYINYKQNEIEEFNKANGYDPTASINGRHQTNIGIFRRYLELYLAKHPKIHNEMTFLVRQLQPADNGIPIEIYVFSNDQAWVNYEGIQSDIFDHIIAAIPEFELRVFQNPTGDDFRNLVK